MVKKKSRALTRLQQHAADGKREPDTLWHERPPSDPLNVATLGGSSKLWGGVYDTKKYLTTTLIRDPPPIPSAQS